MRLIRNPQVHPAIAAIEEALQGDYRDHSKDKKDQKIVSRISVPPFLISHSYFTPTGNSCIFIQTRHASLTTSQTGICGVHASASVHAAAPQ
jgi:hypothetical protein